MHTKYLFGHVHNGRRQFSCLHNGTHQIKAFYVWYIITYFVLYLDADPISTYFSALHSLIGVGFLVATFLVTPFLPEDKPDNNQTDNVCNTSSEDSTSDGSTAIDFADSEHNVPLLGVPKLAWPFIISGTWCMVFSCGYAILGEEDFLFL